MESETNRLIPLLLASLLLGCGPAPTALDAQDETNPSLGKADAIDRDRDGECPDGCSVGSVCHTLVCVTEPGPPRLVSPLSGALVSGTPMFHWFPGEDSTGATLELCDTPDCSTVIQTLRGADWAAVDEALPAGIYFVRGFGQRDTDDTMVHGVDPSETWMIEVRPERPTTISGVATLPDFDRDGNSELVVHNPFDTTSTRRASWSRYEYTDGSLLREQKHGIADPGLRAMLVNAGDVDGDGYPDLALSSDGAITWFRGSRAGLQEDGHRVELDGGDISSLAPLGDVNGDGYADLIAGQLRQQGGSRTPARATLFVGGPQGLSIADAALAPPGDFVAASGAGDFNGDGFADVLVRGTQGFAMHSARVHLGSPDGPLAEPVAIVEGWIGHARAVGDVNGDGYADLGVLYNGSGIGSHRAEIRYGSPGESGASPSVDPLEYVDPNGSITACQERLPNGATVRSCVLWPAGDVNGDGFDDVLLVAQFDNHGDGSLWLYQGSPEGVASRPSHVLSVPEGDPLAFGRAVASIGDWNRDGRDELAVSASYSRDIVDHTQSTRAAVYVFQFSEQFDVLRRLSSGSHIGKNDSFGATLAGAYP